MAKKLIIIIAPPGAGKGTQADLIAEKFGLFHLETSKIIKQKFAEADPNDKMIRSEKAKRDSGGLMESKLIYKWLMDEVGAQISKTDGLVLSGSPRTEFEVKKAMPEFEKMFGRDNIKIFEITLSADESVKRNANRRMCQANRHSIPNFPEFKDLTACPRDNSPLFIREDDKPEIIRRRYLEYLHDTSPVLVYFRKKNYQVAKINGEQPIKKVFEDICEYLK